MDFCDACRRFNISLAAFISHPGADENTRLKDPIHSLGTLAEIHARDHLCPLCRLLFAAFRSGPLKKITELSELSGLAIFGVWINALGPTKEQRLKSPALSILIWAESPRIPPGTYKIVIRAVSKVLPDQPHFGQLSSARFSFLDFELIKPWLKHCERAHKTCSRAIKATAPTKNFFLIDVKHRRIVAAPERCRYIALSYVWGDARQMQLGNANFNILTQKHSLVEEDLTATIRDAIRVTAKLGERYLWVDALCIIQDSEAVRQQSIQDMDRIYADALLTVVAGSCKSSSDPLPGVLESRTRTQWYQKISHSLTLTAHFDFKDLLGNSTYSQRAWTYQEYQLSMRLLIFASNGQVYFSCKEAVYSEDVILGKAMEPDAAMMEGAEMVKLQPHSENLWSTYSRGVRTFTGRSMKLETDVLNAFSGILRMICKDRTLEGLPLPVFDLALLWQPKERLRRRQNFCSWSWAGWIGKVHWFDDHCLESFREEYETEQKQVDAWIKQRGWIVWYSSFGANTGAPAYITDGPPWFRGLSPSAESHEKRFPGQPRNFAPNPSLLRRLLDRLEPQRRHIRYLQFWTASTYFHIELDTSAVIRYASLGPENTGNGLRLFVLRDNRGQPCGWVLLDEDWVERSARENIRLQEFIMLSEGRCGGPGNGRIADSPQARQSPKDDFLEYNAMMITWTGGIAERAGLGRVMKDALTRSCARPTRWKEIILG